ncbi:MAG: MotA/TolQ/ExbB proton channel family protein [Candidatus Marinimicrobia bacterium]|nr:MotA/TolQ/ExbB proton channel family protein [Candidatus Neomarinimicrobiota bacterium]MCH8288532.1 MotA/TolQ/ExbB proton channel family protein [Candidatus Neomarinimicrobiota bacterium]
MIDLFLQGGPFMWPILILFILGIALSIERLWTLLDASIDTRNFMQKIKVALNEKGFEGAMEISSNTKGPVASLFYAGLMRAKRGIEAVEKAIGSAGTIEMAFLERNLIWLATIATIAPLLGFTGTVSGMVNAFQDIAAADDISPSIVAGGISEALLTTLFGLIVAMIIQTTHNFFVSRIDRLIIDMEESSVELVESLIELEEGSLKSQPTESSPEQL